MHGGTEKIIISSNLAINNFIKLTVYSEHTHDISTQYQFSINDDYSLAKAYELVDSLYDGSGLDTLLSDPDYVCPIVEMGVILEKLDTFTKDELVVITISGTIRDEELILYDSKIRQLKVRDVDDFKHVIYEDFKLYLSCSNILFRFETIRGKHFYIKLNSAMSDISIDVIDGGTVVEFEFATLIKPGREYPFEEVDFVTTIDVTRSEMVTIKDLTLVSMSGVDPMDQGRKPVRFKYRGVLVQY